jgi:hypothetical protein
MSKLSNLNHIIDSEYFIVCPFLPTERFISYCSERNIRTSGDQLELFEKLGIFYPVARVRYPKYRIKIEYFSDGRHYRNLGPLEEAEEWPGETKEVYSSFYFKKDFARSWLEEGYLWSPSSKPFVPWETFKDEEGDDLIESFYSMFQCYSLHELIESMQVATISADQLISYSKERLEEVLSKRMRWAERIIAQHQEYHANDEIIPTLCQIISNRYYPQTQTDRRTIKGSGSSGGGIVHSPSWSQNNSCVGIAAALTLLVTD